MVPIAAGLICLKVSRNWGRPAHINRRLAAVAISTTYLTL